MSSPIGSRFPRAICAKKYRNLSSGCVSKSALEETRMKQIKSTKPDINVTPLIDVLLVLLIIFMVAAPLKPARFLAKVPSPPDNSVPVEPNRLTLVVSIEPDRTLKLNRLPDDMGTIDDLSKINKRLVDVFAERTKYRVYRDDLRARIDLP